MTNAITTQPKVILLCYINIIYCVSLIENDTAINNIILKLNSEIN